MKKKLFFLGILAASTTISCTKYITKFPVDLSLNEIGTLVQKNTIDTVLSYTASVKVQDFVATLFPYRAVEGSYTPDSMFCCDSATGLRLWSEKLDPTNTILRKSFNMGVGTKYIIVVTGRSNDYKLLQVGGNFDYSINGVLGATEIFSQLIYTL